MSILKDSNNCPYPVFLEQLRGKRVKNRATGAIIPRIQFYFHASNDEVFDLWNNKHDKYVLVNAPGWKDGKLKNRATPSTYDGPDGTTIYAFDKDKNPVATYKSLNVAAKENGTSRYAIKKSCDSYSGCKTSTSAFYFRYDSDI